MTARSTTIFSMLLSGLVLAGCNAGPLLQTGSLTATATPAAPKVVTPIDRALHVGATSARAQKCGFYFDPVALRTNFLAAEAARGTPQDALTKTGQSYDYTTKSIAEKITDTDTYCSADRTAVIKPALQRALAGDFEPPPPAKEDAGALATWLDGNTATDTFNPNSIYDPLLNEPGQKKIE